MPKVPVEAVIVAPDATARDVMLVLERTGAGAAIVCRGRRLLGVVSDGDIRRALLSQRSLDVAASEIMNAKPAVIAEGEDDAAAMDLMRRHAILMVPVIDRHGEVVDIKLLKHYVDAPRLPNIAVVMAGGLGSRLMPLTSSTPKPMLRIGDKPILQIIIEHLRSHGVHRIYVATNHLSNVIQDHFRDGGDFGVEISYLEEDQRMGTAGALTLLPEMPNEPILVANGDVLSRLDFAALLASHRTHNAALTICVKEYRLSVPFGVVRTAEGRVTAIDEKPEIPLFINAGIYCVEPSVLAMIPRNTFFDMTQVAAMCMERAVPVHSFPVVEYWRDIGQIDDFHTARDEFGQQ